MDKVMKQIYFPREEVIEDILRYNHDREYIETMSDLSLAYIIDKVLKQRIQITPRREVINEIIFYNHDRQYLKTLSDSELAKIKEILTKG